MELFCAENLIQLASFNHRSVTVEWKIKINELPANAMNALNLPTANIHRPWHQAVTFRHFDTHISYIFAL